MRDWQSYHKSAVGSNDSAGKPSVREYFMIKLSDNWIAVAVLMLFLICMVAGLICTKFGAENSEAAKWSFDSAKLCLGVFLGLLKK